mmetsp:Transcript_56236/g.131728  ORF Transcript_56236/g.131728 Transcript_56236/m.131728 type:complete len:225 (+) Transcript_56236:77-751(+)
MPFERQRPRQRQYPPPTHRCRQRVCSAGAPSRSAPCEEELCSRQVLPPPPSLLLLLSSSLARAPPDLLEQAELWVCSAPGFLSSYAPPPSLLPFPCSYPSPSSSLRCLPQTHLPPSCPILSRRTLCSPDCCPLAPKHRNNRLSAIRMPDKRVPGNHQGQNSVCSQTKLLAPVCLGLRHHFRPRESCSGGACSVTLFVPKPSLAQTAARSALRSVPVHGAAGPAI